MHIYKIYEKCIAMYQWCDSSCTIAGWDNAAEWTKGITSRLPWNETSVWMIQNTVFKTGSMVYWHAVIGSCNNTELTDNPEMKH